MLVIELPTLKKVNLDAPTEFQVLQSDITIYRKVIYKSVVRSLLKGWVFIGEVGSNSLREYKLMYFSCENKTDLSSFHFALSDQPSLYTDHKTSL